MRRCIIQQNSTACDAARSSTQDTTGQDQTIHDKTRPYKIQPDNTNAARKRRDDTITAKTTQDKIASDSSWKGDSTLETTSMQTWRHHENRNLRHDRHDMTSRGLMRQERAKQHKTCSVTRPSNAKTKDTTSQDNTRQNTYDKIR